MTIVLLAGCSMLTQGTKKLLLKMLTQGPIKEKVPSDNDPRSEYTQLKSRNKKWRPKVRIKSSPQKKWQ